MKKIRFNLFFVFTSILLLQNTALARKQEFTKMIYKEFNIDPYGTTQLINKYGKIDAKTWDGNQVKIKVTIIANSNSQSDAEEIFNRIKIDFYNDAKFVKAETHIGEAKSKWVNFAWISFGTCDYSINYEVYYPRGNYLDLSNKYGDSYIGNTNGAVKANIKYGNLRMEEVNNSAEVNLAYGNGNIGNVKNNLKMNIDYGKIIVRNAAKMDINGDYSEFDVESGGDIKADGDYTTFRLGKVNSMNAHTDYGNVKVRDVENITFNGDYSDLIISTLGNFADVKMEYGALKIDNVGKGFSEVKIDGNYTDVTVSPELGCDYRVDASTYYSGIKFPAGFSVNSERKGDTKGTLDGYMGSRNAKGIFKVNVSYGGFKIR